MKRRQAENVVRTLDTTEFGTGAPAPISTPVPDSHITAGNVLWTLTHEQATAQARRWLTPAGLELELQIWSGAHVEGQEDLCWSQLFTAEEALAEAALAKKRQLEAAGWLEQLDARPL